MIKYGLQNPTLFFLKLVIKLKFQINNLNRF